MHKHSCECKHGCLHYCERCQKVYCCKCGKEWGNPYYYYPNSWWTTSSPTITCGTTTMSDSTHIDCDASTSDVTCTHAHD